MALRILLLASCTLAGELKLFIDDGFDDLSVVRLRATETKEKLADDTTVVLESRTIPYKDAKFSNDGYPRALQWFFIGPLVFQQTLGSDVKIELILPLTMTEVSDKEACKKGNCVEEILNNGPNVFYDVAMNDAGLAGRLAILSNAFGKVRLQDNLDSVLASEIGKDVEEDGPHRTWGKLAEGLQTAANGWLTAGIPPSPLRGDDHSDIPSDSWYSGWFSKIGIVCGIIPLMAWLACYATTYFTRPRPIAAPLLGDVRLDEGDACEAKFDGRKVTEYSHLNV